MQIFKKRSQKALNRVLTLPKARSRKMRQFPVKKYGFTKQKHIRGDKTLKIYNVCPNVIYYLWGALDKPRRVTNIYEFYVPVSALALGGITKKHGSSYPGAKCQK